MSNVTEIKVFETSRRGGRFCAIPKEMLSCETKLEIPLAELQLFPEKKKQTITGIGGSFTDASAFLIHQMSPSQRKDILESYFGEDGANYSLTRTHMNSCDFSRFHYSYAAIPGDNNLDHFSIEQDLEFLIPMIVSAQKISKAGFKIIASPWTAPPWMKDNNHWVGGQLLPEHYATWGLFFAKYAKAYHDAGVPIWGFTVENEPHGNGNNWESMHFTPEQMTNFVQFHLGPSLEKHGLSELKVLGYDQNRDGLEAWTSVMYQSESSSKYFDGTAIHWYDSTYDYFPEALDKAHYTAPNKHLIQTEACCDAQTPKWKDDDWYWRAEATDWGYTWREPEKKYLHPKYAPVHRYARDIIGCLNHWVDGWIDWNMVLDRQGGPNWFENWCIAPVIVDPERDEVYFTPIYDVMCHFSKFIRPGSKVLEHNLSDPELLSLAVESATEGHVLVIFNPTNEQKKIKITGIDLNHEWRVSPEAIQTILIKNIN